MKTSNSKCREFVRTCTPFKGNNLYGVEENNKFVVYSYGRHFPLFAYVDGQWYENSDRYSVTTSKHRSQSHPLCDTTKVSTTELKNLIG